MSWFTDNWKNIIEIYFAVVALASIIVKITPTLKDDNVLLGVVKWVAKYLALNTQTPTTRPQ